MMSDEDLNKPKSGISKIYPCQERYTTLYISLWEGQCFHEAKGDNGPYIPLGRGTPYTYRMPVCTHYNLNDGILLSAEF